MRSNPAKWFPKRSASLLLLLSVLISMTHCAGQSVPGVPPSTVKESTLLTPTNEWEAAGGPRMRPLIDSIVPLRAHLDSLRYDYFLTHVYDPAMRQPKLADGNRQFLNRLKAYLQCPTDSCGRGDRFIRPVFRLEDDSLHASYRIVTNFPYEESDNSYDGSGWGDDTLVTAAMRAQGYKLYFSNGAKSMPCKIQRYATIQGPCIYYRSYQLRRVPLADTLRPAFCSPYALDLDWHHEPAMDSLLAQWSRGGNILNFMCDPAEYVRSFAQLRGVPDLYLGIDLGSGWSSSWYSYFPTVGIFMKVDGKWAVPLWWYQYEMVGCSCI